MENKIIDKILNTPPRDEELKNLKSFLQKEESSLLKLNTDEVLNILDPAQYSLGYTFLLATKVSTSSKLDPQRFLNQAYRLAKAGNPFQIRCVPAKFVIIFRKFAEMVKEFKQFLLVGIRVLQWAVTKLRANSESLTPLHSEFVLVCLLAKNYQAALPVLEDEVYEVSPDSNLVSREVLLYFYYGGMIYTGLKDYKKASNFFKLVVTAPASVLSAIIVEAYKKLILVSLLAYGRAPSLPRYTSSVIQRHQKTSFPQYQEFANAYSTFNTDELHKVAETNAELFQKEKNFGLVKLCIQSLYRRNIQRLTQTYITLSLQDIATTCKLPSTKEVEKYLLKMIESGEIYATINQKDGMVSFSESPEAFDNSEVVVLLDSNIQKTIQLGKKVRTMDETIACSSAYLQKSHYERGARLGEMSEDFADSADKAMGPPKY
jgi:COP9 signalosome complex subunit 3